MLNPEIKIAKSKGIDLPVMYVYLAGFMSGEKLRECTTWRKIIRKKFKYYDIDEEGNDVSFPISFLDPFNGKEFESIDKKGLTSHIPKNAIIMGDYLSVQKADIIVANLDTFGSDRPLTGTQWELAWAWQMKKPIILITKDENFIKHPFTSQASWILSDIQDLLKEKVLESFYRRIAGAIYE